jgi:hypothetical protein
VGKRPGHRCMDRGWIGGPTCINVVNVGIAAARKLIIRDDAAGRSRNEHFRAPLPHHRRMMGEDIPPSGEGTLEKAAVSVVIVTSCTAAAALIATLEETGGQAVKQVSPYRSASSRFPIALLSSAALLTAKERLYEGKLCDPSGLPRPAALRNPPSIF